jgi:hypothetical protein
MDKVNQLFGAKHFTVGELVDVGRRLTAEKLDEMKLLSAVEDAERENVWRLKAAIELLRPLTHILPEVLLFELERAEKQLVNPLRGQADEAGGTPRPEGRTLPKPGTILARSHDYQCYNWKKVKKPDGSESYRFSDTFRFLVVEQPCKLLRLDTPGGPIYRSPSDAASEATKSRVNGWDYFGIK